MILKQGAHLPRDMLLCRAQRCPTRCEHTSSSAAAAIPWAALKPERTCCCRVAVSIAVCCRPLLRCRLRLLCLLAPGAPVDDGACGAAAAGSMQGKQEVVQASGEGRDTRGCEGERGWSAEWSGQRSTKLFRAAEQAEKQEVVQVRGAAGEQEVGCGKWAAFGAQPCCSWQTGIVGMHSACTLRRCIGMCTLDAQTANSTAKAALQFTPEGIEAGGLCAARRARCTANLVADIVQCRLAGGGSTASSGAVKNVILSCLTCVAVSIA